DHDLAQPPAEWRRYGQAGYGEELHPYKIERMVENPPFRDCLARKHHLHDWHGSGVILNDDRWRDPRRQDAQNGPVDGIDLSNGCAEIGALVEKHFDQPDARNAV